MQGNERSYSAHSGIVSILEDTKVYAVRHKLPRVAALISAAIFGVSHVLYGTVEASNNISCKEDQWFSVVLDELTRYCHIHGMTEPERHLIAALDAWHIEREIRELNPKIVTYPLRKLL